jgi:hypothetical protein
MASATRERVLEREPVHVAAEALGVDRWSAVERLYDGRPVDESPSVQRSQLADPNPVTGHDEALTRVKCAHDLAALVAKLALGNLSRHTSTVARVRLPNSERTVTAHGRCVPSAVEMLVIP